MVCGIEMLFFSRYPKPISVARKVLDNPSLSMLVGAGATQFAAENGFVLENNASLMANMVHIYMHVYIIVISST